MQVFKRGIFHGRREGWFPFFFVLTDIGEPFGNGSGKDQEMMYCTTPRKRGGAFLRGGAFRARKFLSPSSRGGALAIPPVLRFAWGGILCS